MRFAIFSTPRGFRGIQKIIQTNAIRSWKQVKGKPEIILVGDEEGVPDFSKKHGLKNIRKIETNQYGTPLISDIFKKARDLSRGKYLLYLNSDIILDPDIGKLLRALTDNFEEFLAVGRRWNIKITEYIDFKKKGWYKKIAKKARTENRIFPETGVDVFIFRKNLYHKIPKFAVGRTIYDNWLMFRAKSLGAPLIDITKATTIIHQDHPPAKYSTEKQKTTKLKEKKKNLELAGGYYYTATTKDADYLLNNHLVLEQVVKDPLSESWRNLKKYVHKYYDRYVNF